jgi:DNA-binding transcriptional regulator YhcF (GntR family)
LRNQTSQAYQVIRDKILGGVYRPAESLTELALAQELGASRNTVKKALLRLASENLVVIEENKRAMVRSFSIDEVLQNLRVREVLEGLIAREAIPAMSDADFEEMEIMKKHTNRGADILTGSVSEVLQLGEIIALTHHEKWDGSGYPNGLKGEEIPITGRITAICDVFDALLSERPYKKPWSLEAVLVLMKNENGLHFDPRLLQLFLDNLNIFIDIRRNFEH